MPCILLVIGVSLSKPQTSVTLLHVRVYVCLLAWTDHLLEILNQRISLARALFKFKVNGHGVLKFFCSSTLMGLPSVSTMMDLLS